MATLKGQNLRIYIWNSTAARFQAVGMATNCTVTLTNNTDDASHKDIVSAAAMPTVTSKSWQVSVDSLSVEDTAAILSTMKAMQPMMLLWDESTSNNNNQELVHASFSRKGMAYLSDVTFAFNNRENSTKTLQFQGTSPISNGSNTDEFGAIPLGSYTKGQYVRLFLSSDNTDEPHYVIAAARQLQLHVSLTLEDATTKDTAGDWQIQEPTGLSYDISTSALVRSGETITSLVGSKALADLETIYQNGTPVKWRIANVGGDNNRTPSSTIVSGSVVLTQLTLNGPNRQNADYTAQLAGYGDYTVAA